MTTLFVAVRLGVFLAEGLELFFLFAVLGSFGIALRRRSDFHKRLMLLATIPLLDAAIQRSVAAYTSWGIDTPYLRSGLI